MLDFLRELRRYIWTHILWLGRLKRVWICIAALVFTVIAAQLLPGNPDDRLRYAGLALQLLGVGTVALLLRDKRVTFDRKGILVILSEWVFSRPRFKPQPVSVQVSGAVITASVGTIRAIGWQGTPPEATVDQRVKVLEANLETLRQQHLAVLDRLDESIVRVNKDLCAERLAREEADRLTSDKLEKFGAEGLHIEATGLVWLVAGIVLATIPSELVGLLSLIR